MLRLLRASIADANRPVTRAEALALLEALFQHYPATGGSVGMEQRWKDWLEDVSDLPRDVLAAACRKWRRADNRFAPSPGQLLALVDTGYLADEKLVDMAIRALENAG
jgi:hypothetical protein